jgi:hypothetical protein
MTLDEHRESGPPTGSDNRARAEQPEQPGLTATGHDSSASLPQELQQQPWTPATGGGNEAPRAPALPELFEEFPEHGPNPRVTVKPEEMEPWGPGAGRQSASGAGFHDVMKGTPPDPETRYLWTAASGSLNIAPEWVQVSNDGDPPRFVQSKHTNVSGQASVAGEAWFSVNESWYEKHDPSRETPRPEDITVYIDTNSGRFGHSVDSDDFDQQTVTAQWELASRAWAELGYNVQPALPGMHIDYHPPKPKTDPKN